MKKSFTFLISFVLIACVFSISVITANAATATSGVLSDNISWSISESGTLTLNGTGDMPTNYYNFPWKSYPLKGEVTSVNIENGITSISFAAFNDLPYLKTISIGNTIKTIGNSAFSECPLLSEVTIPNSVETIGNSAFRKCYALTSVTFGENVSAIDNCAFEYCRNLTTINWNAIHVADFTAHNVIFNECGLEASGITVNFGNKVEHIPAYIFCPLGDETATTTSATPLISYVKMGNSVKSIGDFAFNWCEYMYSIEISNNIETIGKHAFTYCSRLDSLTLPDALVSIGDYAFYACGAFDTLEFPDKTESIGAYAFANISATKISLPKSVTYIGEYAFTYNNKLSSVTVATDNSSYASKDNVLFDKSMETLILYPSVSGGIYSVPNGVKTIAPKAFAYSTITEITFPDSLMTIENSAFENVGTLNSINFGNGIETIGEYAFSSCYGLTELVFPCSLKNIGYRAFYQCRYISSVTFGHGIETIAEDAFTYNFNLQYVNYCGSATDWNNIAIDSTNTYHLITNNTFVYNYCCVRYWNDTIQNVVYVPQNTQADLNFKTQKIGCTFLGWNTYPNAKSALPSYTVTNCCTNLYPVFKENVTHSTSSIGTTITTDYGDTLPAESLVIMACYKDGKLAYNATVQTYNGTDPLTFLASGDYDTIKLFAWKDFSAMTPLLPVNTIYK